MSGIRAKVIQIQQLCEQILAEIPADPRIPAGELKFAPGFALWKPDSESDGKLVVLLPAHWPQPEYCEVLRRNETWERMHYDGSDHNGNRHHFRASKPGQEYAGKRKNGGVQFYHEGVMYRIFLEGPPRERHG